MEYHILDTETASLKGGVCEIAWLVVNDQLEIQSEFHSLVNPERPIEVGAQAIHGIADWQVRTKPTLAVVAGFLDTPRINLIGHNCAFDERMIAPAITPAASMCTLAMSRMYVKGVTNHKLETLQAELKLPERKSHSALGDVHTVRDLLLYVCDTTGLDLPTLWNRAHAPKILHKMPYGKHAGKPFNLIPRDYRDWLLQKGDLDKDLRYTLETFKDV